ncbi:hypothetical protein [Lactovum odontotermitis]
MMIQAQDLLKVVQANKQAGFDFQMYSWKAEHGLSLTDKISRHSFIPAGSTTAYTEDEKGEVVARIAVNKLIVCLWESLAQFSMEGRVICAREAYGQPMEVLDEELFHQEAFGQLVEEDLFAAKTGREVIAPDLSEVEAASLMKSFAAWKKEGGE